MDCEGTDKPDLPVKHNIRVIQRPNLGREAGGWLDYIVQNYENLPEWMFMLQGIPFLGHTHHILTELRPPTGLFRYFCSHSRPEEVPINHGDDNVGQLSWIIGPNLGPLARGEWGGQHQVSKTAVLRQPLSYYKRLLSIATSPNHEQRFSYYCEYWWSVVFKIQMDEFGELTK